jgi:transcriptional regulator with GAF, ATPase, and Fis domain
MMDTKITQEPRIAAEIIKQIMGQNPDGVTINVISIGTIHLNSHTQDNSKNQRQIEHKPHGGGNHKYRHTTKDDIVSALIETSWNQTQAAKRLELSVPTMQQRVRLLGGINKLKEGA